jgi:hypothetical protein
MDRQTNMLAIYQLAGMLKNAVKTPFSGWLGSTTINLNRKKKCKIFYYQNLVQSNLT